MLSRNKALLYRISDVDIRLLRVFRTVVDCGGLAASEFELNIGRSTISRHLSDMETRIGMKLCNRGPGGFSLTREGELVLEAANQLMDALFAFQSQIDDIHQNLRGTLRLAFFDLAAGNPAANLQQAIARFSHNAPDVNLELSTEAPNVIEAGVISGRFDIGVVPMHARSSGLQYHPLYPENMVMYCGRGHPLFDHQQRIVDAQQLCTYKYAGFGFNSPNMLAGHKLQLTLSAKVHNEEALKVLLLSGQYLGFLPDHVAAEFVLRGELAAVASEHVNYQTELAAIVRKRPEIGRKTGEFLQCLKAAHEQRVELSSEFNP